MIKTVEEVCKELNINLQDVIDEASRYYEAKIARPQYKEYWGNLGAQLRLLEDCTRETLWSYISVEKARKRLEVIK